MTYDQGFEKRKPSQDVIDWPAPPTQTKPVSFKAAHFDLLNSTPFCLDQDSFKARTPPNQLEKALVFN
jgi:hypothetical protein